MASTYTSLGIEKMATGENAGTWGTKTNTNLDIIQASVASYVEKSIAGGAATTTLAILDGDATESTSIARSAIIKLTGSITGNQVVTVPDSLEKTFVVVNGTTGAYTVQFKTVSGSGVTFATTDKGSKFLFADATNINEIISSSIPADNITTGDAASTFATSAGAVLIDSQASTATIDGHTGVTIQSTNSGDITLDSFADITLDADGGDIFFKDAGTTFGSATNTSGNLIIKSGTTTAATFSGANVTLAGTVEIDGTTQLDSTLTVGVNDTGYDVKLFGATSGKSLLWDESADSLIVTGTTTLVGTTNLDAVDIDGAVQLDSTLTVGANDQGYDIIIYGDTASANLTWDTSVDDLILNGAARIVIPDGQLVLSSTAVTSTAAELNLLDGVTGLVQADFTKLAAIDATAVEIDTLDALSRGSIIYGNASAATTILTKGTANQVLTSDGTDISWATPGAASSVAADNITAGDAAVSVATSSGAITVDSNASTVTVDGHTGVTIQSTNSGNITLDSIAAINIEPASGSAILLDGTISIDAGVVTGATSITSTAFVGALTGNVTGNASGTAATVTTAAQSNITSLGTLTTLTVDNIITNGATIGHTSDTDLLTLGSALLTVAGAVTISGITSFPDGTAGAPSITNTGDVNTGLLFSAADTMSFSAGGTAQFTMADGAISPVTDNDIDLGTASLEFKNVYVDGTTFTDALGFGTVVMTLPTADGSANQILTTNGSGALAFVDNSGGTDWQAVKTANFTAAAGQGVFANTTSSAWTVTLPAGSIGDEVSVIDYAGTFDTNNLTVTANGSEKIHASTDDLTVSVERAAFTLVFTDSTQGWLLKDK